MSQDTSSKIPQSDPHIPSQAPTGAPMNDVELDRLWTDLENSFLSFLREDPSRFTSVPAIMAAQQFEIRIKDYIRRSVRQHVQEDFTQEKANLQAALEAELPIKLDKYSGRIHLDIHISDKKTVDNSYATSNSEDYVEGYNNAREHVLKAIAAVFNKGGKT